MTEVNCDIINLCSYFMFNLHIIVKRNRRSLCIAVTWTRSDFLLKYGLLKYRGVDPIFGKVISLRTCTLSAVLGHPYSDPFPVYLHRIAYKTIAAVRVMSPALSCFET